MTTGCLFCGESASESDHLERCDGRQGAREAMRFDGADYQPERDDVRLTPQFERIFALMADGHWRTLKGIAALTDYPEASISAQLRHMRKPRFGQHTINRRYCGGGLYEYQLEVRQS